VKTIFIADNEFFYRKYSGSERAENMVNMQMAASLISVLLMNYARTRRWEAADYSNFFSSEGRASLTVPAFTAIDKEDFKKIIERLDPERYLPNYLLMKIKGSTLAEIDFSITPSRRALSIIALPAGLHINEEAIGKIEQRLIENFAEHFKLGKNDYSCTIIPNVPIEEVWVTTFFIDPYIPRIAEIYKRGRSFLENKEEIRKHVRRMTETIPGELSREISGRYDQYIDWMEKSYKDFVRMFSRYTSFFLDNPGKDYSLPMLHNYSSSPLFLLPLKRRGKTLGVKISEAPRNRLKSDEEFILYIFSLREIRGLSFRVHQFEDRGLAETFENVFKILGKDGNNESLGGIKVALNVGNESQLKLIPVPFEILRSHTWGELPDNIELIIFTSRERKKEEGE
ncbi:hypothetical protein, partial [Infirmifilum sp.]|uniref:hypothetical protein n=1 Tax=Infirmifilum sp. TaxID=2856575 RepID=UPI003D149531